jgi:hypothetical protein
MKNPTITTEQRDVLYGEILIRITGISDVLTEIERGEFDKAQRLADEFADYLRLLADDLGWGEMQSGMIELTSPPDLIRRTARRLIRIAEAGDDEMEEARASVQDWERRSELVRRTCDQLLVELPAES